MAIADSGVPYGTLLGFLLFLALINDLSYAVQSWRLLLITDFYIVVINQTEVMYHRSPKQPQATFQERLEMTGR